jgi:hypothetical protein
MADDHAPPSSSSVATVQFPLGLVFENEYAFQQDCPRVRQLLEIF